VHFVVYIGALDFVFSPANILYMVKICTSYDAAYADVTFRVIPLLLLFHTGLVSTLLLAEF